MQITLEKVLLLKNISLFDDVSESALSDFILSCDETGVKEGETLLSAGDYNDNFYIVLTGLIEIIKDNVVISESGPRQFFGELSALCPDIIQVNVIAKTDAILLKIPSVKLYEMMSLHTSIAKGIVKGLVYRLQILDNRYI